MIKDTAATFEVICGQKNITFDLTFSDTIQMVYADLGKIQHVMYNLMDNAIKYSHNNSTIYIQASEKYEKIFISVKDTGIGIPKDSIKKIWDRFYKTDLSRGKDKKGTGLGPVSYTHLFPGIPDPRFFRLWYLFYPEEADCRILFLPLSGQSVYFYINIHLIHASLPGMTQ